MNYDPPMFLASIAIFVSLRASGLLVWEPWHIFPICSTASRSGLFNLTYVKSLEASAARGFGVDVRRLDQGYPNSWRLHSGKMWKIP